MAMQGRWALSQADFDKLQLDGFEELEAEVWCVS
jgi:hypothetical protein